MSDSDCTREQLQREVVELRRQVVELTGQQQNSQRHFLESITKVDRVIRKADDLEQMMSDVLQVARELFDADRAWLLYPCDGEADSWRVPMESTKAKYPGAFALGEEIPMLEAEAKTFRNALDTDDIVTIDYPKQDKAEETAKRFSILSEIHLAIHPHKGKPWLFGLHQCSNHRQWTCDEKFLFREIGQRLAGALASLHILDDLRLCEDRYRSLFDANRDGYLTVMGNGEILDANRSLQNILGFSLEELQAKNLWSITPEKWRQWEYDVQGKLLVDRGYTDLYEKEYIGSDGNPIPIEVQAFLLEKGEDLESARIGAFVRDITERKKAEGIQQKNERLFHTIAEASLQGTYYVDVEGRITYANHSTSELTGYPLTELEGLPLEKLFPPGEAKVASDSNVAILNSGKPLVGENTLTRKDGSTLEVYFSCVPVFDKSGHYDGFVGSVLDITERKQAEAEREKLLRGTTERVKELQCMYGVAEAIRTQKELADMLQDVAERIPLGLQYPEITRGKVIYEGKEYVSRPFDETQWKLSADIVVNGMHCGAVEVYHLLEQPEMYEGQFLLEERDLIEGIARNVSEAIEHRLAQKQRERTLAFMQEVIDGVPESMMVINLDHTIALANRKGRERAGGADPVTAGLKCYEYSHELDQPCDQKNYPCPLQQVIATKAPVTAEHIHIIAEGHSSSIELVAAPIFDDKGEVVQIIESCRDISERRNAEADRLSLERQVQHAQKLESLGVLAGGIAHDFNNLLTVILGNAELALHGLSPHAPARSNIQSIEHASQRAAELARQMLAYSGKGMFTIQPIDLQELITEMSHLLDVSISKKAVLKYNYADNLPTFEGDTTQIHQIIMNLITNASEAIGDKSGVIALSTGAMDCDQIYFDSVDEIVRASLDEPLAEGLYVYLEVADTGCGMDVETVSRIFDPFFTTKFTGRGLGMAAVLGIVRGHGGAIKIYSEPGKGTTFKILFPASTELPEDSPLRVQSECEDENWQGQGTVLIADDEDTIRALGKRMLNELGFDALTAADGSEVVELFRDNADEIVCVLLDLTMPHMDGEQAFRELRRIKPDVKVILCSGYNERDATQQFVGKGLAGFIQKPYGLVNLRDKIMGILER
ncbi:MAG TPA: PAS domain S-box protein [Phycisphaerae bacterium]|nr:PAS domain S-box protein [Phycisphaerae bacterium]